MLLDATGTACRADCLRDVGVDFLAIYVSRKDATVSQNAGSLEE